MKHWRRLVDVCRQLGIHRNLGESLCRRADLPVEKDFSDDYRISPKAANYLTSCVAEQEKRDDWILLQDFASELELPANIVDGGMRKLGLTFAHNFSGQVVFPQETRRNLLQWRDDVAERKSPIRVSKGKRLFKLRRTAEESAAFFAALGTVEHAAKVEALCARYRFWIQRGLESVRMGRTHYFDEKTHEVLLNEISTSEAARLAGVAKTTIKDWARKKWLPIVKVAPTRRSYSRSGLIELLRKRFRNEGKMKKRTHVPVRLLPPSKELAKELRTTEKVLTRVLRLAGGASAEDLMAIQNGQGSIRREIWETVDQWRIDLAAGRRPSCAGHSHAASIPNSEASNAEGLAEVLAFLSGAPLEQFERLVGPRFTKTLTPIEIVEICKLISLHRGQLRVYTPSGHFEVGDLLLDPEAHDFGAVESIIDGTAMDVQWVRREKLRMVHR